MLLDAFVIKRPQSPTITSSSHYIRRKQLISRCLRVAASRQSAAAASPHQVFLTVLALQTSPKDRLTADERMEGKGGRQ
jgi:hypothetical protein